MPHVPYIVISRFISRPLPRFRTGQRQARRLGTSLALIFRQMASTWPLVTLVDVFCYITSKIMMHTEGHDDQELYITSVPYTCLRVCIPGSRSGTDKPRITEHTSNRRQRQTQLEQRPGTRDTGRDRGSRTKSIHEMSVCLGDLVSGWE